MNFPCSIGETRYRLVLGAGYGDKYGDGAISVRDVFEQDGKYTVVNRSRFTFTTKTVQWMTLSEAVSKLMDALDADNKAHMFGVALNMFNVSPEERVTIMDTWIEWNKLGEMEEMLI